jgi:hypothetical protein
VYGARQRRTGEKRELRSSRGIDKRRTASAAGERERAKREPNESQTRAKRETKKIHFRMGLFAFLYINIFFCAMPILSPPPLPRSLTLTRSMPYTNRQSRNARDKGRHRPSLLPYTTRQKSRQYLRGRIVIAFLRRSLSTSGDGLARQGLVAGLRRSWEEKGSGTRSEKEEDRGAELNFLRPAIILQFLRLYRSAHIPYFFTANLLHV